MIDKASLRSRMRARRRALSGARQRVAATRLRDRLLRHPLFMASRDIAFYVANDGEIDPRPAIDAALSIGKRCYLPVLGPPWRGRLLFARLTRETRFVPNRFDIPEPDVPANRLKQACELDLVLVPLVAFDASGNRIGMGGGFYDRTLAFLASRGHWRRPRVVGLAHGLQRVESIAVESWDMPLEAIVTDEGVHACRGAMAQTGE